MTALRDAYAEQIKAARARGEERYHEGREMGRALARAEAAAKAREEEL